MHPLDASNYPYRGEGKAVMYHLHFTDEKKETLGRLSDLPKINL